MHVVSQTNGEAQLLSWTPGPPYGYFSKAAVAAEVQVSRPNLMQKAVLTHLHVATKII